MADITPTRAGFRLFLAWTLLVVALPAIVVAGPTDKLDPLLRARARDLSGRSRVIVEFLTGADERVFQQRGVTAGRQVAADAQAGEVDNQSLAALASDSRVRRIVPDHPAFATMERTGAAIGATLVREELGLTGAGIGVAVIDSGASPQHDDLYYRIRGRISDRVVHFRDFTRPLQQRLWTPENPSDEYGHGTHVAGIIAGSGFDSDGRRQGIAPNAGLVVLKVLDGQGHGYVSDVIAAIDYAIAVRQRFNIRVINLSVATGVFESYRTDPLAQAARRAVAAGIVVVASAGNLGESAEGEAQYGGITSPGNAPWVLTAGAASHQGTVPRPDDRRADFSSQGPTWIDFAAKPDILAYGVGIESLAAPNSTLARTLADYLLPGTRRTGALPYLSLSGTSMAAPVISGTVALMLEANPRLTPNAVKAILQYTAQARGESALAEGAGLVNARGAVRMAQFFARPRTGVGIPADLIAGTWTPWSRHLLWGNYLLAGGVPLPGSNAWLRTVEWGATATSGGQPIVWGARTTNAVVWGTREDGTDNIVWSTGAPETGDNIVWSTGAPEAGDNIVWSTGAPETGDNIVWSTGAPGAGDNIVWSTGSATNVVWGTSCGGLNCQGLLWSSSLDGSQSGGADNIVWSTFHPERITWNAALGSNVVRASSGGDTSDNIVWSTQAAEENDNIVWSTTAPQPVLWQGVPPAIIRRSDVVGRQ